MLYWIQGRALCPQFIDSLPWKSLWLNQYSSRYKELKITRNLWRICLNLYILYIALYITKTVSKGTGVERQILYCTSLNQFLTVKEGAGRGLDRKKKGLYSEEEYIMNLRSANDHFYSVKTLKIYSLWQISWIRNVWR